jgi:hypothetical protein
LIGLSADIRRVKRGNIGASGNQAWRAMGLTAPLLTRATGVFLDRFQGINFHVLETFQSRERVATAYVTSADAFSPPIGRPGVFPLFELLASLRCLVEGVFASETARNV